MQSSFPLARIASGLAIASVAFIAGFSVSTATSEARNPGPIVNTSAWAQEAPKPATHISMPVKATCNPWEVSEVAMEEVLDEMVRRGWRPPNQGNAVASMVSLGTEGIYAVDPNAPMPRSYSYRYTRDSSSGTVAAVSDEAPVEEIVPEATSVDLTPVADIALPSPS
jgi:hypothetical protein